MTKRAPIWEVLSEGLARGTPQTVERVNQVVGFLSSIGETSYLYLVRAREGTSRVTALRLFLMPPHS